MSKEEKEKKERVRREYAKRGERSSKMMSFRIDFDNWEAISSVANKGRLINDLIERWRRRRLVEESHLDDEEAEVETVEDNMK